MGEIQILGDKQRLVLADVGKNSSLKNQFYWTGGTALSDQYLKHRESEDLDLFSEKKIDGQMLSNAVGQWAEKYKFVAEVQFIDPVYRYVFKFEDGQTVLVDFSYSPFRRLEKGGEFLGVGVDSLFDIAVNKLLTLTQRNQVKDFVDLYFLLQKFSIWDLREGVLVKYRMELDPFIIASDLLLVEGFDVLPKMIKPLKMPDLKKYYNNMAKSLGMMGVEK